MFYSENCCGYPCSISYNDDNDVKDDSRDDNANNDDKYVGDDDEDNYPSITFTIGNSIMTMKQNNDN